MKTKTAELIQDWQTLDGATLRGNPVNTYDDGFGGLWVYESADFDFGIIRAMTWEDAYEIVEDEILPRADWEQIEREFPGIDGSKDDYGLPDDDLACFNESYGLSANNGWFVKPLNGERLEPLTREYCDRRELLLQLSGEEPK